MTLTEFIERIKKDYSLEFDTDKAIKYVTAEAAKLPRNGNSVGVDDDTVKEWILNGIETIKSGEIEEPKGIVKQYPQPAPTVKPTEENTTRPSMKKLKKDKDDEFQLSLWD